MPYPVGDEVEGSSAVETSGGETAGGCSRVPPIRPVGFPCAPGFSASATDPDGDGNGSGSGSPPQAVSATATAATAVHNRTKKTFIVCVPLSIATVEITASCAGET